MNTKQLAQLELKLLQSPTKFNLSRFYTIPYGKSTKYEAIQFGYNLEKHSMQLHTIHECMTHACIVGHLALLNKDNPLLFINLKDNTHLFYWSIYVLGIPAEFISSWEEATATPIYYNLVLAEDVNNLMAADVIRHLHLYNEVPEHFNSVEKFYSTLKIVKHQYSSNDIEGYSELQGISITMSREQDVFDSYSLMLAQLFEDDLNAYTN